ncbi:MAG: 16S rRNA (guanine(966)-N(2))-methyltransferase RsmD [Clostridiales bacterium]|nr:16S rRNA (guanine(966)-N(2))-methyltransferase RsmD [Clostridiales bacterium]
MRVITGSARGRRLKELEGMETRPTTDRVKEGLFSAIQFDIEGRRVLDLFAGTGQLGIEALSRGAVHATFVDCRKDAVALIRENLAVTNLTNRARVVSGDSLAFLTSQKEKFDLVFLDPPYAADLLEKALDLATRFDILSPNGIIIVESPTEKVLPAPKSPYGFYRDYCYGKIKLTIFRREGNED